MGNLFIYLLQDFFYSAYLKTALSALHFILKRSQTYTKKVTANNNTNEKRETVILVYQRQFL